MDDRFTTEQVGTFVERVRNRSVPNPEDGAIAWWIIHNRCINPMVDDGFWSITLPPRGYWVMNNAESHIIQVMAAVYSYSAGRIISCSAETGKPEDATQYTSLGIEPIEIMRKNFTREEFIGFLKGNVVKYTFRKKGQAESDINKLVTYSKWLRAAEHDKPIQIGNKVVEAPRREDK